jgi:hypothetical protein
MPTSRSPSSTTGTPLIEKRSISRSASRSVASGRDGHRVLDHPALGALDPVHLLGLPLDRHVLVDDADPALARHGDRHARLGHGVHRRGDQRDRQPDRAGELRLHAGVLRVDLRVPRGQQHVVEGERLADDARRWFSPRVMLPPERRAPTGLPPGGLPGSGRGGRGPKGRSMGPCSMREVTLAGADQPRVNDTWSGAPAGALSPRAAGAASGPGRGGSSPPCPARRSPSPG